MTLHAKNSLGSADRELKIVCGPTIGLTPAMGWNSWNCFAGAVTQERVKAAADAMVSSGLINHGWTYINIDDYWEVNNQREPAIRRSGPGARRGRQIVPNPRFPGHERTGGLHSRPGFEDRNLFRPGPTTCGGCIASWQHEDQDAQSYADWGFDYLKYDWCSYTSVAPAPIGWHRRGRNIST